MIETRVSRWLTPMLVVLGLLAPPGARLAASTDPTPASASPAAEPFTLFEAGPVRPLALSPNGKLLFACNTPDNRLEVFQVLQGGLQYKGSIPVGLEPVAVAARSDAEVWVVNHLSDSVSIVQLAATTTQPIGRVVRTLLVGDEPRDIVFGGSLRDRAFITTAHRGQNAPYAPQELVTPGVNRADVWVFKANAPADAAVGGTRIGIVTLFTDTPRALAVSPDGKTVYAAGFHTGNQTTVVSEGAVPDAMPGSPTTMLRVPDPRVNFQGIPQPETGLIVKRVNGHWVDEENHVWDDYVKLALPDTDVFAINADANPPVATDAFAGVGTVLFNMAVNPKNGRIYVSNTDAKNEVRFEGAGNFLATFGKHTVRGHTHESHITVLGGTPRVRPVHLNPHIHYNVCCAPTPSTENSLSVAMPVDMSVTKDGKKLYVAAFGTSEVAVYDTAALESGQVQPSLANQVKVSGGGPGGLALDEARQQLYVLTRFDNAISVVNTAFKKEVAHVRMFNPEPQSIVKGRRFLYDAQLTSSHGDTSCASCHIFGDFDSLAWDLGDPDNQTILQGPEVLFPNPPPPFPPLPSSLQSNTFVQRPEALVPGFPRDFAPMKGPMTTQSLRGLANHGAMHWRGDRVNNTDASAQPNAGAFDEQTAFRKFNIAFLGLNGRSAQLPDADMQAFTNFALQITYPPNPVRALDNSLDADQEVGRKFFFGEPPFFLPSDAFFSCNGCHAVDRGANAGPGMAKPGFFGTDGRFAFIGFPQVFKVPHLRNLYQKVGMFGMGPDMQFLPGVVTGETNDFQGNQIRGFGFEHDGAADTINRFHSLVAFVQRDPMNPFGLPPNPGGFPMDPGGNQLRRQVEQFLLAFDSNLYPAVGQQVTLNLANRVAVMPRIQLLAAQADAGHCDLVAKADGHGFWYTGSGQFKADRALLPPVPSAALLAMGLLPGKELTFTCAPPGSGKRIGIDRDADGVLDGDE